MPRKCRSDPHFPYGRRGFLPPDVQAEVPCVSLLRRGINSCILVTKRFGKEDKMAASRRRKARRQKILLITIIVILVVIAAGIAMMATVVKKYFYGRERSDYASFYGLQNEQDMFITYDHSVLEDTGILSDGEAYVPYSAMHDFLNARFYWDETEHLLRYTIPEGIVNAAQDTTEYTIGKNAQSFDHVIVKMEGDEPYISLSFIEQYTNLRHQIYENPNRVVISDQWGDVSFTNVKHDTAVRELGGTRSPILTEIEKGDLVTAIEETDSWTKVCTEDGFVGYVKGRTLGDEQIVLYESEFEEPEYSHMLREDTVNMAWHQVTNQTANKNVASVLASAKGLKIISPTWFYLNDNTGEIASLASADYVAACHQQGVQVWALISNLENPDVNTTQVLNVTSNREKLINNLVAEAVKYDLDGINVDFENLEGAAGVGFLQFIRELSLRCRANDIILSVDNYSPASYNSFYTWDEQAVFADYIILMAYDEHYNGSEEEGSVASIGFVQEGVENMLKYVPAEQLILGVPFYTRLWQLTPDASGSGLSEISSEALGMADVEKRIAENGATFKWLDSCGQYYAEYSANGNTYKVWAEEAESIGKKLEVMQSNGLAGAAFWKLGYEKKEIWDAILTYIQ